MSDLRGSIDLVAVDVDGTLRTTDHTVTARTLAALAAFRAQGGTVMMASGRPEHGLHHLAEVHGLGLEGLVISSCNGAIISDAVTGDVICSRLVSRELVAFAAEQAAARGLTAMVFDGGDLHVSNVDGFNVDHEAQSNNMRIVACADLASLDVVSPKVLISGEPSHLATQAAGLREVFADRAETALSAPCYFEVTMPGVDKGSGLLDFCRVRGIDPSRAAAFGDHENDMPMIRAAGLGVAMGNALPQVKSIANRVTLTNDEDGIAVVVEELLHG